MADINTGATLGVTENITNTVLNTLADNGTVTNIVNADISASADIAGSKLLDSSVTANKLATDALELAYPVGSIYMNASDATNPSTLLGFGTWVTFGAGRVLVGLDSSDTDFDTVEETGGAKTHTLTAAQSGLPSHTHSSDGTRTGENSSNPGANFYSSSGNFADFGAKNINQNSTEDADEAHNNLQPYIVVYMWKRTA